VDLEVPADLPPVAADELYVGQIVGNLLSNALKYSSRETDVHVAMRQVDGEVEVRVRDRGIGLSPESREAIFELLVRTPEASRYAAGAGIGLYVCRRLVEVMDGRIWAEPAPDTGSVFAFRLPVAHE